jgi:glucose/mannose transport system permease protein
MSEKSSTSTPTRTLIDRLPGAGTGIDLYRVALYVTIFFFVAFFLTPIMTGLLTSFKTDTAVAETLPFLPPGPSAFTLDNWSIAFDALFRGFINSLLMSIPATLLCVLFGSMAAYGITLLSWRGQIPILVLFLIGIFIPYQAVLVPLSRFWTLYVPLKSLLSPLYVLPFIQPAHAQLVQLIITHVGYGIPICTLLFRSYYQSLPGDLVEAAQIDGASITSIYRRIVLPLSTPMIGVVLIYQFTQIWNEFLFALTIVTSSNSPAAPITLILAGLGTSLSGTDFGVRMAGAFLAALPTLVIYVLFAEQFAEGLETG